MRRVPAALFLCSGCGYGSVVQTIETSWVATQVAAVPSPMAPLGIGQRLELGQATLLGGGSVVGSQPLGPAVGQRLVPLTGLGRVATAVTEGGLELVVSGGAAPASAGIPSLGLPAATLSGVVGRGSVGLRAFAPLERTTAEWSFSVDVGALASVYRRTDTYTVTTTDRWDSTSDIQVAERPQANHLVPDIRLGTVASVPLPGASRPVRALGGLQMQTWPAFWERAEEGTTCTTWSSGRTACHDWGAIPDGPSSARVVFTPTVGAALDLGPVDVHGLVLAHVGPQELGAAPFGAMVAVERRFGTVMHPVRDDDDDDEFVPLY